MMTKIVFKGLVGWLVVCCQCHEVSYGTSILISFLSPAHSNAGDASLLL